MSQSWDLRMDGGTEGHFQDIAQPEVENCNVLNGLVSTSEFFKLFKCCRISRRWEINLIWSYNHPISKYSHRSHFGSIWHTFRPCKPGTRLFPDMCFSLENFQYRPLNQFEYWTNSNIEWIRLLIELEYWLNSNIRILIEFEYWLNFNIEWIRILIEFKYWIWIPILNSNFNVDWIWILIDWIWILNFLAISE